MRLGVLFAAVMLPPALRADPVAVVNALRIEGCDGRPGVEAPVQRNDALADAARELSRGERLQRALERVAYPAASSRSYHVRGSPEDDAVERILAETYCAGISDPRYDEIGAFQSGDETWIVLAVRKPAPVPLEPAEVAQQVLDLVNTARGEARRCGGSDHDATGPLMLSAALNDAALSHARDMAERGSLGHRGSDGSSVGERVTRSGYAWRASAENIAAGQRDAEAVVAAWLASPGHCANLMGPYFSEMGVAFALAPSKNPAIYWTQVFAAPR